MPDADNNFGGSLGLDFRKWWRHVQPKNSNFNRILTIAHALLLSPDLPVLLLDQLFFVHALRLW